jgi:U3 small nucleolar RNA-associated protein 21
MQSGKERGLFISKLPHGSTHSREVTGLGIDLLNKYLVSSSLDKTIKLWDFYRRELLKNVDTPFPIDNLVYNRNNDLVGISSSDLSVSIFNAKTNLTKVRDFQAVASNRITDICFS